MLCYGRLHMGDVPPKTEGKATHALQCSWISMTACGMVVSARNAAITSSVGGSLENYSSKAQQHSWTTMTARWQHGCLRQELCMDVPMMELSKRRTLEGKNREEGNGKPPRLFSLDMIPIDGCFEDLATVAAVLRHQLPPAAGHRRLLQGCLAAVAAVLRRRLPPAK